MAARRKTEIDLDETLLGLVEQLATANAMLKTVAQMTESNFKTIHGDNGTTPGLLVRFENVDNQLSDVRKALEGIVPLAADVAVLKQTMANYPSLTWLVRHRFKEVAATTMFVFSLAMIFASPFLSPEIRAIIQIAISKALTKWLGI